jgi:DNA-binding transcriptional ArsR family regulator
MKTLSKYPFSNVQEIINEAEILKIIGHPVRLKMLIILCKQDYYVKQLCECLDMKQAVVSSHLHSMKSIKIIEGRRKGVEKHYSVISPLVRRIVSCLNETS